MHVILKPRSEMAQTEIEEFWNLEDVVYPNGFDGPAELKGVRWDDPTWDICVRNETEQLISHVGILERDVLLDGEPIRIAGIAEMLTHPEFRRQGYGAAALREAANFMHDKLQAPFALLTCPLTAIPFYSALGWQRFHGSVNAEVEGGMGAFAESAWMVLPVTADAPDDGALDLQGIPW